MSDMLVVSPFDIHPDDRIAPMGNTLNGEFVPSGLAGIHTADTGNIYCPDCFEDNEYDDMYPLFGDSETNYMGTYCDSCERVLQQNILVYPTGPGGHVHVALKTLQDRPVLESKQTGEQVVDYWVDDTQTVHFADYSDIPDMCLDEFSDFVEVHCNVLD